MTVVSTEQFVAVVVQMAWEYLQTHLERLSSLSSSLLCDHAALYICA